MSIDVGRPDNEWINRLSELLDGDLPGGVKWETALLAEDVEAYFKEVLEAFRVHVDREGIRRGLWKQYPAADQVRKVQQKADRNMRTLELIAAGTVEAKAAQNQMLEELDDIINYAIFAKRLIKGDTDA